MISLREDGVEWRGDDKHVTAYLEKLLSEFGSLETATKVSNLTGVKTPGIKSTDIVEIKSPLSAALGKAYRGLSALGNYMSQDRPDISFASKEISKSMSSPCEEDIGQLKRLGRYLRQYPVCALVYQWQDAPICISAYSDSDWGGDIESRRSTSGEGIQYGKRVICHWSRTQHVISLSSAEAELHGLCTCASEGLGVRNMMIEMNIGLPLQLFTDSSAARGIIQRQGAGRVKHLDIKSLWIQEREKVEDLSTHKIPRLSNWSDLLTHHWTDAEGERYLKGMNCERR